MKWVFVLLFGISVGALTATPVSAKPPKHASTAKPKAATSGTHRISGHVARTRRTRRHVAAGPSYQVHPDPQRYQQIQQALADKGYFKGDVNGVWGDDSVDALKRFQADQKIDDDGKIDALTLIGLGLGPKHGDSSPKTAANRES